MSGNSYAILGYGIGLTLLWGYALSLWWTRRELARRGPDKGDKP